MKYVTHIRKRRRGARLEWTARLIYKDQTTGKPKERSKSARTRQEAIGLQIALAHEFVTEFQAMEDSIDPSFAYLLRLVSIG